MAVWLGERAGELGPMGDWNVFFFVRPVNLWVCDEWGERVKKESILVVQVDVW